jgi:hypothetical protein
MNDLIPIKAPRTAVSISGNIVIPAAIAGAGEHAVRRFLEFFAATIRNRNTREAYYRAACSFFAWLEQHKIGELADIEYSLLIDRDAADNRSEADGRGLGSLLWRPKSLTMAIVDSGNMEKVGIRGTSLGLSDGCEPSVRSSPFVPGPVRPSVLMKLAKGLGDAGSVTQNCSRALRRHHCGDHASARKPAPG